MGHRGLTDNSVDLDFSTQRQEDRGLNPRGGENAKMRKCKKRKNGCSVFFRVIKSDWTNL